MKQPAIKFNSRRDILEQTMTFISRWTINDLGGKREKNSTATHVGEKNNLEEKKNSRLAGKKIQGEFSARGPPPDH